MTRPLTLLHSRALADSLSCLSPLSSTRRPRFHSLISSLCLACPPLMCAQLCPTPSSTHSHAPAAPTESPLIHRGFVHPVASSHDPLSRALTPRIRILPRLWHLRLLDLPGAARAFLPLSPCRLLLFRLLPVASFSSLTSFARRVGPKPNLLLLQAPCPPVPSSTC